MLTPSQTDVSASPTKKGVRLDTINTLFGAVPIDKKFEWLNVAHLFAPLTPLFVLTGVTDIFVDRFDCISIEQYGKIKKVDTQFPSEKRLQQLIKQIATCLEQQVDEQHPILDARLPDCSRLCCTLPNVTPQGATLTLRVAPSTSISADTLVSQGTLSQAMLDYLKKHIEQGSNIIVSGNTGSGKTTLLRALARFIPIYERIITCEDTQELYLDWLPYRISLEAPNRADSPIEMKNLIEASLRMRPDRIWVGEIRKAASADAFLQAINTGHSGCVTTLHANNCLDAIARLQYLIASEGLISYELAYQQITSSVDILVHASRHHDYGRKITEIVKIENNQPQTVFLYDHKTTQHLPVGDD